MTVKPVFGFRQAARAYLRRFYVVAALFVSLLLSVSVRAQNGPLPEYKIKSAFLYNFAKFIQWPPERFEHPNDPLIVGIIGNNPFHEFLNDLEGKKIGEHQIVIKLVDSVEDARKCHVLFIGENPKRAAKIVGQLGDHADVLTVTDEVESFQSVGAVINLVTSANRTVHFEINVDAARRAELKINSSLLNLAKIVRDGRA